MDRGDNQMVDELEHLKEITLEVQGYIEKGHMTEQDLSEMAKLAYEIFDKYAIRPIYPDERHNSLIGRKYNPTSEFNRDPIDVNFFKDINRVKYLMEYLKIKPLLNIMEKEYFNLPRERVGGFPGYIQSLFKQYQDDLEALPKHNVITKDRLDEINQLCDAILGAIGNYLDGFPSSAYQMLEQGMKVVIQHAQEFYNEKPRNPYTYRMRIGNNHVFNSREMFHIPFELRGIVSTQRYSIPGLPCLYLGSSSYVCWEEMNKPDLNSVQTSMFVVKPDEKIELLDLGYPPNVIRESIEELMCKAYGTDEWDKFMSSLIGYLVIWPLIAACSVRVLNRNDSFKPEYIIPQLLLQWVRLSPKYDGICYFSVAAKSLKRDNFHLFLNYALPVKSNIAEGHCEKLKSHFWATDAVSWELFQVYKNAGQGFDIEGYQSVEFEPIMRSKINYGRTDFAKLEAFMKKQRPNRI
jgi:hypothetical protein